MIFERDSGTRIVFDITKDKSMLNIIEFGVKDSVISFSMSNLIATDKEIEELGLFLDRFINNTLPDDEGYLLHLDTYIDDAFLILEFINNNTMNGVDVGEKLMELKVCYPTNYNYTCGDYFGLALYPHEIKWFIDEINCWKKQKYGEKDDSELDDPTMLVRQKDGRYICVPFSKLESWCEKHGIKKKEHPVYVDPITEPLSKERIEEELLNAQVLKKDTYDDIANNQYYYDDWDKLVFAFIEKGNASHALAQNILKCSYVKASRTIDILVDYCYVAPVGHHYTCLISREQFEKIIQNRK